MKKLEKLKLTKPENWEAERLARWLYEWNLLQASVDVPDGGDTAECLYPCLVDEGENSKRCEDLMPEGIIAPMDSSIEVGQIRLMAPSGDEDMVYITVASVAADGEACCVPFSPLAEPAMPSELLSGRDSAVARVYCLWNMRDVANSVVSNSWVVDRLGAAGVERLQRAIVAYHRNEVLPDDLLKDAGPQLVHPEDPRREYMYMERRRIDLVLSSSSAAREININYFIESEPLEFLKAAEPGEDYET